MRQRKTLAVILAAGVLLGTPLVWGCEGTGMQNCTMSDCPMAVGSAAESCHDTGATLKRGDLGCHAVPEVGIACCDTPVDQEPAQVESAIGFDSNLSPLVLLSAQADAQPPPKPPDSRPEALLAQQYDLGRFTLLSSFLL